MDVSILPRSLYSRGTLCTTSRHLRFITPRGRRSTRYCDVPWGSRRGCGVSGRRGRAENSRLRGGELVCGQSAYVIKVFEALQLKSE